MNTFIEHKNEKKIPHLYCYEKCTNLPDLWYQTLNFGEKFR
jgi:hypothetical protein